MTNVKEKVHSLEAINKKKGNQPVGRQVFEGENSGYRE